MKQTLKIAVRALVEHTLRSGNLNLTFTGASRAVAAIRAHQKVQKSRPAHYEPEVPISREIETDEFLMEISGRIDGVYAAKGGTAGDPVIIDEIKTTTGDLAAFQTTDHPIHWGQAKTYAHMYATVHDLDQLDVQLTYYHLDTRETLEIRRSFDRETLAAFFDDLVKKYLAWASVLATWCRTRDESIDAFGFPFPEFRPGQREMGVQVYKTIQHQHQLLVQAPTGIGKTMAALFPAIKAFGRGFTEKIFYLTARTTARTVAEKAMTGMGQSGLRIKSLTLTAKDKICFNPESACNGEECDYARGHFDRIRDAVAGLFTEKDHLTREAVEAAARTHQVCPFEFSLELTRCADVVICDYNYAFDPRVYLRRFFGEDPGNYTFLVDEAHNLVDRSRDMFSAAIHKQPFLALRRGVKEALPHLYKTLGKINTRLVSLRNACENAGDALADPATPHDLADHLATFHAQAERWLARNKPASFREELLDLYFEVGAFLRILEGYDGNYITCMEKAGKDVRVKLFCINPAGRMKEALDRCKSAVFFSATLAPFDYFRQLFGCHDSAFGLALPSPFPKEHFCLLMAPAISTRYRNRENSLPALVRAIHALVSRNTGNHLLFFPSYQYMAMAHDAFSTAYTEIRVITQTQGMTEAAREAFLEEFTHENTESLVGFAVMGGIFGEGIDLEGDRLSGAVIVGVGLPGISMENELIREFFNQTGGTGFEYAYLYPGINRVLQAAGRVIRSETDRGAVLLIDERYPTARYRGLIPPHWDPCRVKNERDIETKLADFWGEAHDLAEPPLPGTP